MRVIWSVSSFSLRELICQDAEVESKLKSLKIPVELCLTSNVMGSHRSSYDEHQFRDFYNWGHPLSLGVRLNKNFDSQTDDTCLFLVSLSEEYLKVAETFKLSKSEMIAIAESAIDQIFGSSTLKQKLKEKFLEEKRKLLV